ncbi:hypothetical protein R1sor_019218 [Riccia sorocarpa]|uniref:PGG domain-containing protein n=1 Tax=Riccia sorocarpa TaxID=122646 RepID=A0ABD3ICH3_9MARC
MEQMSQTMEKILQVMEKIPETTEKMTQTMEKILQVMEKIPETTEKMTQTMEKYSQSMEMLPRTMEKMAQTPGKLPQTLETEEKLRFQDEWLEAMTEEDGCRLMKLVVMEPHLLTVKYKGCNALHLAMRHNWYGLVQEILLQFKHLSSTKEEENGSSSSRLDLAVLRDLLTCKEGDTQMSETSEAGSSGMDVLAMAVIQCHQAINTLLVRTISKLPGLFPEHHIYKDVVWCSRVEGPTKSGKGEDKREDEREILRMYLVKCLPEFSDWFKCSHAPNLCFDTIEDIERRNSSAALNDLQEARKRAELDPALNNWMLTCPFLPFAEYLILDSSCNWSEDNLLHSKCAFASHLDERKKKCTSVSRWDKSWSKNWDDLNRYIDYLVTISDTRRLVLHHALLCSWAKKFTPHPLIPYIGRRERGSRMDSSGRIVFHLLIAMEPQPEVLSKVTDMQRDSRLLRTVYCHGDWEYSFLRCRINLSSVHRANGFVYYKDGRNQHVCSTEEIILTSPHLEEQHRIQWEAFLRKKALSTYSTVEGGFAATEYFQRISPFPRPAVQAGIVSDLVVTSLQLGVSMGSTTLVQKMIQKEMGYPNEEEEGEEERDGVRKWTRNILTRLRKLRGLYMMVLVWGITRRQVALYFAAEAGDPEMLRMILETGKCDLQCKDEHGNTPLHAAVSCEDPSSFPPMLIDFVEIPKKCFPEFHDLEKYLMTEDQLKEEEHHRQKREKEKLYRESRRQGCINLLLQEGADIWETDNAGKIANPGTKASPGYSLWWYEKLTRETQEQKTNFSAAGTAVSVTAALVATASYIGPLQPPLGYTKDDEDGVSKCQTEIMAVRVFFVLNTLAFYLAIAAVVLSLTPSLPLPHESIREELKRIRRNVTWALILLIVSLIAVLSAFASASIVVISNTDRWNQGGLTTGPVVAGCIVCLIVLILCCRRAFKLVCHRNRTTHRLEYDPPIERS